jgi:hypothetical protein
MTIEPGIYIIHSEDKGDHTLVHFYKQDTSKDLANNFQSVFAALTQNLILIDEHGKQNSIASFMQGVLFHGKKIIRGIHESA